MLLKALLMLLITPQLVLAGLVYEGSSTIGENIMYEAAKAFEAKTKIKFDAIGLLGSGKACKTVIEGEASIGGLSRKLNAEERKQGLYYQIIGYDALAVFVHENNPIKGLSKEQIKAIFTGKVANWRELGGRDAKITVVTEIKNYDRATIKEFQYLALEGAEFGPAIEIDKPHDCVKYVATDENAVTHASLSFKMPGVRAISVDEITPSSGEIRSGAYMFSRPLILVTKEVPKGEIKKFMDFIISAEGQKIVSQNFVPIRR